MRSARQKLLDRLMWRKKQLVVGNIMGPMHYDEKGAKIFPYDPTSNDDRFSIGISGFTQAPISKTGPEGQINSEGFKGRDWWSADQEKTVQIVAAEYRARRLTKGTTTSTNTYVMIWRPEIGLYEKRHMYWENFRDLLGAADEALDYQWAYRLKQKDPLPEKSEQGKVALSLTAMAGSDDDPLELWEGVCWHYWNGQGRDGLRWQDLSKIDDAGLPASSGVADALKIRPTGNPKQSQSAKEWYQEDLSDVGKWFWIKLDGFPVSP